MRFLKVYFPEQFRTIEANNEDIGEIVQRKDKVNNENDTDTAAWIATILILGINR